MLRKYTDALTENIDPRFQESSLVLDSFKTFDVLSVPAKANDGLRYYLLVVQVAKEYCGLASYKFHRFVYVFSFVVSVILFSK